MKTEDRFWAKVDKSGGSGACWIWIAGRNKKGYGQFRDGRKMVMAHRYAYELKNGPIPDSLNGLHKCDHPPCCNPAHIFLGTQADNIADRDSKGRQARGERNGSRTHPERRPRGERSSRAKLTETRVAEIRAAYAAGGVTLHDLGKRFGVHHTTIWRIVRGKRWKTETPCNSALHALLFGSAQSTTIGEGDYADLSPVPRFPRVCRLPRPATSRQTAHRGVADPARSDRAIHRVAQPPGVQDVGRLRWRPMRLWPGRLRRVDSSWIPRQYARAVW